MKIKFFSSLLLMAALVVTAVSCTDDDKTQTTPERSIVYAVQSADTYAAPMSAAVNVDLHSEQEWDALLDNFCDYVAQGNTVTFYNPRNAQFMHSQGTKRSGGVKESHNIKTTSKTEMKEWCKDMEAKGLKVVIDYDKDSGTWSGYAYALPPSQAAQTQTYECSSSDGVGFYHFVLTADPVMQRLFVTASGTTYYGLDINAPIVGYHSYNPLDSNQQAVAGATYLYMENLLGDRMGTHYLIPGTGDFAFDGSPFTLQNLDLPQGASNFAFTTTNKYDTWVCEEAGINIVLHVDRSTIATDSYSFEGQITMNMPGGDIPILSGEFVFISDGMSATEGCDEDVSVDGMSGENMGVSVELVSDDMVIWHLGDARLVFNRI